MNKMRLQIISPRKIYFDGECKMIEYNTTEGYVGVLPGHIAMTQIIAPGKLAIYEEGKEEPTVAALHSGIVKIMPDLVMILAEVIEYVDEIDVERAKASRDRALMRKEEKSEGFNETRNNLSLLRAETRLALAG